MVHALEQIFGLLHSESRLIDIHPRGEQSKIFALDGTKRHLLGEIHEDDNYVEYKQADEAIAEGIRRGLFLPVAKSEFTFSTYAGSLAELHEYLKEAWTDAIIEEQTWKNAEQMPFLSTTEDENPLPRIELVENTGITWLRPLK